MRTLVKFLCVVIIAAFVFQMTTTDAHARKNPYTKSTYFLVAGIVIIFTVFNIAAHLKKPESEVESDSTVLQSLYLNPLDSEIVIPHLLSSVSRERNLPTLVLDMGQPNGENRGFFVGLSFHF